MFTSRFIGCFSVTKSLCRTTSVATVVPYRMSKRSSPSLQFIPFTSKHTTSHSFHSQVHLSAKPRQQWSREWQQQKQDDYYRYRNARPLLSPAFFSSPSFRWVVILSTGGATIFYFSNIEEIPVSGRKRFNCFSEESAEAQGEMAYRQIMQEAGREGNILGDFDSRTRMVHRVMARLIEGGNLGTGAAEGKPVGWEINVIHDDSTMNAFVLPGGKVFVYSGILKVCQNDSGLATVLGHEIAHNLCGHMAERMSSTVMIQPVIWALMAVDVYFTGTTSGLGRWLGSILLELGVMRPSSRQQESEADYVGLLLMAQSCYDPREAVGLWERMEEAQKDAPPEWLSTHPSNEHRIQRITEWLPKAEDVRSQSECGLITGYAEDFRKVIQDSFW